MWFELVLLAEQRGTNGVLYSGTAKELHFIG